MKILGGNYKGKKIKLPKKSVRPTKVIIRKAIWDIIIHTFVNKNSFLDGFSGSGIMALEAMSRGVNRVTMVDKDRICIKHLTKTIKEFKNFEGTTKIVYSNITMVPQGRPTDIVFLDPPYDQYTLLKGALNRLSKKNWVNSKTNVIFEVFHSTPISFIKKLINITRFKKQGNSIVYFGHITQQANKNPNEIKII